MLIVGVSGVIGDAAVSHFLASTDHFVIGISRRPHPLVDHPRYQHLAIDLTDSTACEAATASLARVDHLIYTAVAEQPGLITGWHDPQQMQLNLTMLQNLLEPLAATASLGHISLLQGAKAYGGHTGQQPPIPAREDAPRHPHDNFYWLQEDYLRAVADARDIGWTIFRPQVVIGAAAGVAMNPLLPLLAFAMLRCSEGLPLSYPGGVTPIQELTDAQLLAEAFEWAQSAPTARNEIFNITNGDVFSWRSAWPTLARAVGMDMGDDEPVSLADYLFEREHLWDPIVRRHHLQSLSLAEYLGESHHYLDLLLRRDQAEPTVPHLLSSIKLRQAGFNPCRDSERSVLYWIDEMCRRRLFTRPEQVFSS